MRRLNLCRLFAPLALATAAFSHAQAVHSGGWRRVKPCDVGIDAHRSTESQSVALRHPAWGESGLISLAV
jgi:hypothetical protein